MQAFNKNQPAEKVSIAAKLLVLVSFVTWLMGCATSTSLTTAPPERCTIDYEAQLPGIRRVALVTDSEPPIIEAVKLGNTYGKGAAGGAGKGAAAGAAAGANLALSAASDPYSLLGSLLLLPVLVVGGGVVGAVAGTATAYSPHMLAEAEANAQAMLNSSYLQTEMLQRTQDYGLANVDLEFIQLPSVDSESRIDSQALGDLSTQSIDAVLEVELLRITLNRSLKMEARTRLVSTRTGYILSENKHMFQTVPHSLEEWTENDAAPLSEAIKEGLQTLAEDTVDQNFSLFTQKRRENQFAKDTAGNSINSDNYTKRIFAERDVVLGGAKGSEFSPDLLNIPKGKSAVFIYRPESIIDSAQSVPVIINNKYLFKLHMNGYDCLIVEPGKNTLIYPSQLAKNHENITIVKETIETKSNEISYFSVKPKTWLLSYSPAVSGETVIEKEAVDSLKGKRRAKMKILEQE